VGKMARFKIFALSFSSSIFNINTVLLSTTEHFKISGSCFIFPLLPYLCCLLFLHISFFLLWLGASKGGSGPGLSGPLRGPVSTYIYIFSHSYSVLVRNFI
jgi:hypothetical protein